MAIEGEDFIDETGEWSQDAASSAKPTPTKGKTTGSLRGGPPLHSRVIRWTMLESRRALLEGRSRLSDGAVRLATVIAERFNHRTNATLTTYMALAADLGKPISQRDAKRGVQSIGRLVAELKKAGAFREVKRDHRSGRHVRFAFSNEVLDAPNLDLMPFVPVVEWPGIPSRSEGMVAGSPSPGEEYPLAARRISPHPEVSIPASSQGPTSGSTSVQPIPLLRRGATTPSPVEPSPLHSTSTATPEDDGLRNAEIVRKVVGEVVREGTALAVTPGTPPNWPAKLAQVWKATRGFLDVGRFGKLRPLIHDPGLGFATVEAALRRYLAETTHPSPNPQHFAGEINRWLPDGPGEAKSGAKPSAFAAAARAFLAGDRL
jgi:hypothetical protein